MIRLYGPFAMTAGTLFSEPIDQMATGLRVTNDSPYDIWVVFQPNTPSIPGSGQSAGAFTQVCQAWSSQVFPISAPNPNTSFDGTVWFYPVNNGNLAASGTISARQQMYLTSGEQGDDLGTNHAVTRQMDMTSQPRVITIPTEPHKVSSFRSINPESGNTLLLLTSGQSFNGAQVITAYIYSFIANLIGAAYGRYAISITDLTNSTQILIFWITPDTPAIWQPASPFAFQMTPVNGATQVLLTARLDFNWPTNATNPAGLFVVGVITGDIDLTGQVPPPSIGNGVGTPPGTIY